MRAVLLVLTFLLAAAAEARGASVGIRSEPRRVAELRFTAAPGERNVVRVAFEAGRFVFTDEGAELTAGAGCRKAGASVRCEFHDGPPTLSLGDRDDVVAVGTGVAPLILAGPGDDVIQGSSAAEMVYGGGGRDRGDLGPGDDELYSDGADEIDAGEGEDRLDLSSAPHAVRVDLRSSEGRGFEHVRGTRFDDVLRGTEGQNHISGGRGDDVLDGRGGDDQLYGHQGHDRLEGGPGSDSVEGGGGRDRLAGGDGDDRLWGDLRDHTVDCGAGRDRLSGQPGWRACESLVANDAAAELVVRVSTRIRRRAGRTFMRVTALTAPGQAWAELRTASGALAGRSAVRHLGLGRARTFAVRHRAGRATKLVIVRRTRSGRTIRVRLRYPL